jgi:hypothetical protein
MAPNEETTAFGMGGIGQRVLEQEHRDLKKDFKLAQSVIREMKDALDAKLPP